MLLPYLDVGCIPQVCTTFFVARFGGWVSTNDQATVERILLSLLIFSWGNFQILKETDLVECSLKIALKR